MANTDRTSKNGESPPRKTEGTPRLSAPLRSDAQRNRARVLKAAQEAFASEGLAVSLDEIARRAGVGSGTVYRHFSSKEVLFETIILGRLQQLVDQAERLVGADDPAEALLTFLSLTIEEGSVRKDMMDALAGDDIEPSAAVPQARLHLRRVIGTLLFHAQQAGAIRDDISVADLMALITGLILARHRNDGGRAGPQRVLGVVWDGLRAGCSGPVTPSRPSPRAGADRAEP